jgi:hypothetical protein
VSLVNGLGFRYSRPVWLTEMDCPNGGGPLEHELAFMRNVTMVGLLHPCGSHVLTPRLAGCLLSIMSDRQRGLCIYKPLKRLSVQRLCAR